jgi:hypothetical protein
MSIQNIYIGQTPNDGTGDSIRVAMDKANQNFTFLDTYRQNIVTGNITAVGNVSLTLNSDSFWTGAGKIYLNGTEIATVNNLFGGGTVAGTTEFTNTTNSTGATSGAVTVKGGLGVGLNLYSNVFYANSATIQNGISAATGSIGALGVSGTSTLADTNIGLQISAVAATGNVYAINFIAVDQITANNAVLSGNIRAAGYIVATGNIVSGGNITAGNLSLTSNIAASYMTGTLKTASQPNITFVGNLVTANVTGNLIAKNVITNIGTFSNATVADVPTSLSVTNKTYVNSTVIGFAVALG